jgi:hypothetical protein
MAQTYPEESDRFVVPLGIDPAGTPVRPALAQKKVVYRCPGCSEELILKKGTVRVPHFSHHGDSNCNPETMLHKAGKAVISNVIANMVKGLGLFPLLSWIHGCGQPYSGTFPGNATGSQEEYRLPSGRVLDVAVFFGDGNIFGVEIYVTHLVDDEKKSVLELPWIELDAKQLIEDPLNWACLNYGPAFLVGRECRACKPCRVCGKPGKHYDGCAGGTCVMCGRKGIHPGCEVEKMRQWHHRKLVKDPSKQEYAAWLDYPHEPPTMNEVTVKATLKILDGSKIVGIE